MRGGEDLAKTITGFLAEATSASPPSLWEQNRSPLHRLHNLPKIAATSGFLSSGVTSVFPETPIEWRWTLARFFMSLKNVLVPGVGRRVRISRWMPGGAMLVEYRPPTSGDRVDAKEVVLPVPVLRNTILSSESRS